MTERIRGEAEKPIGLPDSLRSELGAKAERPRAGRLAPLIEAVPRPPADDGEGLPLWALVFLGAAAVLAGSWLVVMAIYALRVFGRL